MTLATTTADRRRPLAALAGRLDLVVTAIAAIGLALLVLDPAQARATAGFVGAALIDIAPFFVLSIGLAAYAKASGVDRQIATVFGRASAGTVVAAAVFGALSPFCSCGVLPLIAALMKAGVPLAPVMAFWIASPLMDPEVFVLTSAVISVDFAVARTIAALALGLGAGFATLALTRRGHLADPLKPAARGCGTGCGPTGIADTPIVWRVWAEPERRATLIAESRQTGWLLLRWLTLAFVVESLMLAHVPAEAVAGTLGGDAWWSLPLAAAVGIPAYMNGFAAIPLVGGLMEMGMAAPAALTFMVAGGVTSIPAAMAVAALVRAPIFAWYLALGIAGALAAGGTLAVLTG
ncbi:MAG: permease [Azospirillaceae bacterium]